MAYALGGKRGVKCLRDYTEKLYSYEYVKDDRGKKIIDDEVRKKFFRVVYKQKPFPFPERFLDLWHEREDFREKKQDNPLVDGFYEIVFHVNGKMMNWKEYNKYCIDHRIGFK